MRHLYGKLRELFVTYMTPENIVIILKEIDRQIGSISLWVIGLCVITSIFTVAAYLWIVPRVNKSERTKRNCRLLLLDVLIICCIISILEITVFSRQITDIYETNFQLFYVYKEKVYTETIILQDILNICLFIPLGFLCGIRFRRFFLLIRSVICSILTSMLIEFLQWKFSRGMLDIDDLFFNTVGGFLGSFIFGTIYITVRLVRYFRRVQRKRYIK